MNENSNKKPITLDLEPPLCQDCIRLENRLEWFSLLPFTISALLLAAVTFVLLLLFQPTRQMFDFLGIYDSNQTGWMNVVLAGTGSLLAAVVGGTIVEMVLRLLAAPVFGKLILSRPPTILALWRDMQDVVGLRAHLSKDKKTLSLTFEREEMAREFASLNGLSQNTLG